ncbi:MAG TPA: hypothetical protein VKN99_10430 [Polyangia bacterium]|nr:hypothetical protein [Polyangia bacterium]
MEAGLETEDLARRMRVLLAEQGFERNDVIRFAALLIDAVIREVRGGERPIDAP